METTSPGQHGGCRTRGEYQGLWRREWAPLPERPRERRFLERALALDPEKW